MTATPYSEGFRAGWAYGKNEGQETMANAYIKVLAAEGFNGTAIGHLMGLVSSELTKVEARESQIKSDTPINERSTA